MYTHARTRKHAPYWSIYMTKNKCAPKYLQTLVCSSLNGPDLHYLNQLFFVDIVTLCLLRRCYFYDVNFSFMPLHKYCQTLHASFRIQGGKIEIWKSIVIMRILLARVCLSVCVGKMSNMANLSTNDLYLYKFL